MSRKSFPTVALFAAALTLALVASTFFISPSAAQSVFEGGVIEEIRIDGAERVDPITIRSYMTLDPGDSFDPIALDNTLKNLFDTGLFADVTLRRLGNVLIVQVQENPIINRIAFEGNRRIDNDTLRAEIELRPRTVFTRTRVQQDVQRILNLYRRSGRFAASVEPKQINLDQNRVDIVFEITEGDRAEIYSINFIGNEAFSDSRLRGAISTEESVWFNFLQTRDTYDPDRLEFDKELLRRYYLERGYADFKVLSAVAELAPDQAGFIITFTVEEGERYRFGEIDIQTTLRDLDPEALFGELEMREGDWYDATDVEDSIVNLTEVVGNLGYAFVDVRPDVFRDPENLTISFVFNIEEGPRVFVERIDIQGNTRTLDEVIRREFRLVEGDAFNAAKVRRSRERISNLGFFQTVELEVVEGSTPDRNIIIVDVEEQSTGDLSFGAGFSTSVGVLGNIQLRERNLLGRGQDLRISTTISGKETEIDLSFTEPYFLDREISAGFDLFRVYREYERSFDQEVWGGSLRVGYDLTEHTRQLFRYTFSRSHVKRIRKRVIIDENERGKVHRSMLSHTITWDRRDNSFSPTDGFVLQMTNSYSGLGGDVYYFQTELSGAYYYPIDDKVTLAFKGDLGGMEGLWQKTRLSDRFRLGDDSFRGFEFGGIGPHHKRTKEALGGKYYYKGTVELSFPLGLPDEFDIRGRVFTDFGAVFAPDMPRSAVHDSMSPRISVGPGLMWNSPFGPLRMDLGFPLVKKHYDDKQIFTFSFGTRF